jgi:hypothetical protein
MRFLHPALMIAALSACGGKAVLDHGSGGHSAASTDTSDASSSTTSATGTTGPGPNGATTTGSDCGSLETVLIEALDEAMSCNSCIDGPDPCSYLSGQQLTDLCGCPVAVDATDPDATAAALDAYQAWTSAGCGPLDCDQPCAVSNDPRCTPLGAGCGGLCAP